LPGYYADTAVPLMIDKVCSGYGCSKNELIFQLYGGARSINERDVFNIGRRNVNAAKEILTAHNVSFNADETGGISSRTVEVDVSNGKVKVEYHSIII
jgi:chemotaxis protein CheD